MANPKRRHSNTRTRLRRTHDRLETRSLSKCTNCGRQILPHRICVYCGFYRGKQVLTVAAKAKEESGASS
ncbi:MAG: 50S ribosomal protein L32 [Candidatus Omnitrophica bacterium]|nr:50S ribosomal protein L32 [Candidatus Omnitrophota bacterium]